MNFLLGYRVLISEEISAPNLCFSLSLLPSERKRLVISWALSLNEWMLPAWLSLRQEGSLQIKGQKTTETHPDPPCNTKLLSNIFTSTFLLGKFSSLSFSLFLRRSPWSALFKSSKTHRCVSNNVQRKKGHSDTGSDIWKTKPSPKSRLTLTSHFFFKEGGSPCVRGEPPYRALLLG